MTRLLLLGGGHTHVEVIRRLGADPAPGTEIVLLSPDRYTPYSGMLPGYIAGHYGFHDCHIDLARLCRATRVAFRRGAATRIDAAARRVECDSGDAYEYDVVSIDVGSTQPANMIPGASEHALRVKPVGRFMEAWDRFRAAARARPAPRRIVMVGGGAAGVELTLAMHERLLHDGLAASTEIHLVTDTPEILSGHPRRARRVFENILHERGIVVRPGSKVIRVDPGLLHHEHAALPGELFVLANGATAPDWLRNSALALDDQGFILVNDSLQSVSCPETFAAGDVASMADHALPKSGVFAVRQGPPLTENLRRALAHKPLVTYRPQKTVLALISTGNRYAVASWNGFAVSGSWVWCWKHRIDCRFMATYRFDSKWEKLPA
jgi:selenide, water dikinase